MYAIQSTLVQIMIQCRQATRRYKTNCYPNLYHHTASLGRNALTLSGSLYPRTCCGHFEYMNHENICIAKDSLKNLLPYLQIVWHWYLCDICNAQHSLQGHSYLYAHKTLTCILNVTTNKIWVSGIFLDCAHHIYCNIAFCTHIISALLRPW